MLRKHFLLWIIVTLLTKLLHQVVIVVLEDIILFTTNKEMQLSLLAKVDVGGKLTEVALVHASTTLQELQLIKTQERFL